MNDKKDIILKFMEVAIDRINTNSATIYALGQAMLQKEVVTQEELVTLINDSKKLPEQKTGEKVLMEMIEQFRKEHE
jgi:hypothetical protein